MATADNPFRSARLLYRAVESPDDDAFFLSIQTEPTDFQNSNARLHRPQSRKDAASYQRYVAEEALLGVIICLPPTQPQLKPMPIGVIHLKSLPPHMMHHRFSEIGIDIAKGHQGQGYGTEAIRWCLKWAFSVAGLHRVAVRAFEWNYGARKLYEKLGFKQEGVNREELYHNGRWWDGYLFSMLDREWKAMQDDKKEA